MKTLFLLLAISCSARASSGERRIVVVARPEPARDVLPPLPVTAELHGDEGFCRSNTLQAELSERAFESVRLPPDPGRPFRLHCAETEGRVRMEVNDASDRPIASLTLDKPSGSDMDLWALLLADAVRNDEKIVEAAQLQHQELLRSYLSPEGRAKADPSALSARSQLLMLNDSLLHHGHDARVYADLYYFYRLHGMPKQALWVEQVRQRLASPAGGGAAGEGRIARLVGLLPYVESVDAQANEIVESARRSIDARDYRTAVARLREYLLFVPWSADGYRALADVYGVLGWRVFEKAARRRGKELEELNR